MPNIAVDFDCVEYGDMAELFIAMSKTDMTFENFLQKNVKDKSISETMVYCEQCEKVFSRNDCKLGREVICPACQYKIV